MKNTTTPNKLKKIALEMGESLDTLIPRIVQEEGAVYRAAARLGVAPTTINYWLKKHGYRAITTTSVTWTKDGLATTASGVSFESTRLTITNKGK